MVSVEFESCSYDVREDVGVLQVGVLLDGPLDCCSIAVTVRVDDGTAKSKSLCMYMHNYYCTMSWTI